MMLSPLRFLYLCLALAWTVSAEYSVEETSHDVERDLNANPVVTYAPTYSPTACNSKGTKSSKSCGKGKGMSQKTIS